MAITYPLDILTGFPGWSTEFNLSWRQEQSRTAGGRTILKDFGSPLWRAAYVSRSLSPNELDEWRARLNALENGVHTFKGYRMSRCYPMAYPNGSWPTGDSFDGVSATVHTIADSNKAIRVDELPAGFQLRIGDMIQITRDGDPARYDLHEVQETSTASGAGLTPLFEVRPHLWPGVAADDLVSVRRPFCLMQLEPGSISDQADPSTGRGSVSFRAVEVR